MTKKKIIIILSVFAVIAVIFFYGATRKINLLFDDSGKLVSGSGGFNITFEGNTRYTDKELADYIFKGGFSKNPFLFLIEDRLKEHVEIPFIEQYDVEIKGISHYQITFYEKSIIGYVSYMGNCMYFDKDGIVVESSTEVLPDIPCITGLKFDHIVLHSKLPVANEKIFQTLLNITQLIEKYDIHVEKLNITDKLEVVFYLGKIKVDFGVSDDKISDKIMDLKDIIPAFADEEGTLDMRNYDSDKRGYTLKKD